MISSIHAEELKKLPAPDVAVKYYTEGDLYLFGKSSILIIYLIPTSTLDSDARC